MNSLPIYLINLDKDKQRLKKSSEELGNAGIFHFMRIAGVDGKNLTGIEIKNIVSPFCEKLCTLSIIGCAMSHMNAWKMVKENNYSRALILEDDIELVPNFKEKLSKVLQAAPIDFDMLFLGCLVGCNFENSKRVINDLIFVPHGFGGFHAYIVSYNGARKLLDMMKKMKIQTHIDIQISQNSEHLTIYACNPLLAYQKTDIGSNNNSSYPIILNVILKDFKNKDRFSLNQMLFSNYWEIFGIPINYFVIFMVAFTLLYGYLKFDLKLFFISFLAFNVIEIYLNPKNLLLILKLFFFLGISAFLLFKS